MGRGGLKLEAALDRFGMDVQGACAVDVGSSTGGFTEALLRHGAAHVTAVDVGRGQLAPALRADGRVTSLEGTDWKRLTLHEAPGPFDFFTVDVSFVAARNMLRGLAFRLRPGAEGVVLVKPQFELPDRLVRGGKVEDPALRARALAAFAKKAAALGFSIVQQMDSPVPGGSGTVEILAHLRFGGRPANLPQDKGTGPRAKKAGVAPAIADALTWFAVAAPGLEAVVEREVRALPGVAKVEAVSGGVSFEGGLEVGMRANLWLRVATRVLVRVGEVHARDFAPLRRRLASLPWKAFVPGDRPVRISASTTRCRLYHTGALAENLSLALRDRLGPLPTGQGEDDETRILLRGEDDRFTASVDSSGALLHRRGARVETGRAPLRETLAAGVLMLVGYDGQVPFVDPMCGAGTIALEACAIALDLAPGLGRPFAFERWPGFDAALWRRLRDEAQARRRPAPPAPLFAFDRDADAIEVARRNAERAGMPAPITIERAAVGERTVAGGRGIVVVNPPYGKRLSSPAAVTGQARALGRALRAAFPGWRAGVLCPDRRFADALGIAATARHALQNGGLRVQLVVLELPAGPRERALVPAPEPARPPS